MYESADCTKVKCPKVKDCIKKGGKITVSYWLHWESETLSQASTWFCL